METNNPSEKELNWLVSHGWQITGDRTAGGWIITATKDGVTHIADGLVKSHAIGQVYAQIRWGAV